MSNLLPIESQRKMWAMYRARFLIVISLVMLVLALVGFAALVPGYLAITLSATQEGSAQLQRDGADPVAMIRAQALVNNLAPVLSSTSSPTDMVLSVIEKKPRGIAIDRITYIPGQITLGGTGSRETVTAYRTVLTSDPRFTSVAVPVAALVGSEGNRFSMTISGNF